MTKTRNIIATIATIAAVAALPAAAPAAMSGTTPPRTTHTSPTNYSTLHISDAWSNGQEGSASDEWCEQAADLANYYHDRGVDFYLQGNDETGDKNIAVSEDIATQAEDAGCVVAY